jgi:signal transduction histidine kinase
LAEIISNLHSLESESSTKIQGYTLKSVQHEVEFYLRDNGVEFDMKDADRLFDPFERVHSRQEFEGSGIGLATVKRILDRHAGRIRAEAVPGLGATFFFTLPV